jgi:hypothetical protein
MELWKQAVDRWYQYLLVLTLVAVMVVGMRVLFIAERVAGFGVALNGSRAAEAGVVLFEVDFLEAGLVGGISDTDSARVRLRVTELGSRLQVSRSQLSS